MATDFPLERFLKTAAMLSSPNEQERATAAKRATSMLEKANLDWTEVLRRGLAPAAPAQSMGAGFGDLFKDLTRKAQAAAERRAERPSPAPPPRAPSARILQGEDIPHFVSGTVTVREKRLYEAGKHMLVVGIHSRERGEQYDPLVAFDPTTIAVLEQAAAQGTVVAGRVRRASSSLGMPVFMLSAG